MEITIEQLLAGKATQIKNRNYLPTKQYVEPFLEKLSKFTDDFRIQVKLPQQMTFDHLEDEPDVTYNRVLIQAVLPGLIENHKEVVGFIYGLDVRRPVVKIYKGALNMACINLCIFDPSYLSVQELEPEKRINFTPIDYLTDKFSDHLLWIENLRNSHWTRNIESIRENLGKWIINSINCKYHNGIGNSVSLANSMPIKAYKMLFDDTESPYYIPEDSDVCQLNVYNAFTEILRDDMPKDIVNYPDKTLLLREIMEF